MLLYENSIHPLLAQDEKILRGLFAEIGTFNQNGRRYPEDIYESAYEELVPKIRERRLLGELDHPIDYDEVRLSNVSHAIIDCEIIDSDDTKKVYGAVELLDTPAGLIAQSLVRAGIPLGISSRGVGSTRQVRDGVEVDSLKLITYDLVAEPSFSNAILSPEKSKELEESLKDIESKLPLNESTETQSLRDQIYKIRESLIERKTDPIDKIDIDRVELESVKALLESTQKTLKSDTEIMINSRREIKSLREALKQSEEKNKELLQSMFKLQDSYNTLVETSLTEEKSNELREEIIELRKQLATEKRGMSYANVSELLEGASTESEIENRLNSLSSISRSRQLALNVGKDILKEEKAIKEKKKLTGLASIISRV